MRIALKKKNYQTGFTGLAGLFFRPLRKSGLKHASASRCLVVSTKFCGSGVLASFLYSFRQWLIACPASGRQVKILSIRLILSENLNAVTWWIKGRWLDI
ncbi:MAG: hypothetical protein KKC46_13225 [Proteobacteria bacterium]|nr:hypothetical protein [Pseudomonadota bacterium]